MDAALDRNFKLVEIRLLQKACAILHEANNFIGNGAAIEFVENCAQSRLAITSASLFPADKLAVHGRKRRIADQRPLCWNLAAGKIDARRARPSQEFPKVVGDA